MSTNKPATAAAVATVLALTASMSAIADTPQPSASPSVTRTATPKPTPMSAVDRAKADGVYQTAYWQYRVDLAKWDGLNAARQLAAVPINTAYNVAVAQAWETYKVALKSANTDALKQAARAVYSAAVATAKTTRDTALAALPALPAKPKAPAHDNHD